MNNAELLSDIRSVSYTDFNIHFANLNLFIQILISTTNQIFPKTLHFSTGIHHYQLTKPQVKLNNIVYYNALTSDGLLPL